MCRVAVRIDFARVRHRHVTEKEHSFHVGRVGVVIGCDEGPDVGDGVIARDIVT